MAETYELEGKTLLFLVKDIGSIHAALSFLQRREIAIEVVTDLKEAVRLIENNPPDFFCVSVNYPHPKVCSVPKVIETTFGLETILFTEKPDRRTSGLLARSNHKNLVYGTLTGPSLILKIRRILRERQNQAEIERMNRRAQEFREDGSDQSVTGQEDESQMIHISSHTSNGRSEVIGQVLDDDLSNEIQEQFGRTGTEGGGFIDLRSKSTSHSPTVAQQLAAASDPSEPIVTGPEFVHRGSLIIQPGVRYKKGQTIIESKGASRKPLVSSAPEPDASASNLGLIPMEPKTNSGSNSPTSSETPKGPILMPNGEPQQAQPVIESTRRKSKGPTTLVDLGSEKAALETIKHCMSTALSRTCRPPDIIDEIALLESVSQMGLIPVTTEFIRGYVMIALAREDYLTDAFLKDFNAHFKASLFEQGTKLSMEEPLSVRLAPFEIQKMVKASGEHSMGGQHLDSQALVSFIRRERVLPRIQSDSNSAEMALIDIGELPSETPLTFETFLHLPLNKKFIRYIKNGGKISKKQKERLQGSSIDNLAIHQRDQEKYKTFFAEIELASDVLPYQKPEDEE